MYEPVVPRLTTSKKYCVPPPSRAAGEKRNWIQLLVVLTLARATVDVPISALSDQRRRFTWTLPLTLVCFLRNTARFVTFTLSAGVTCWPYRAALSTPTAA